MKPSAPVATLHLDTAPRVEVDGRVVRLSRKGLALLCYLALEGPTRRQRVADLLWDHGRAMKNLRVEIYRLRSPLRQAGVEPFSSSTDPLSLGPHVRILQRTTPRNDELMAGLEDVASGFQAWLETHRARRAGRPEGALRGDLLDDLAKEIVPPFVLVLQGRPGAEIPATARQLARRLELPFFDDLDAGHAGVHYVRPDRYDPLVAVRAITADERSVWVVERSRFGEDPMLLLQLRAEYPATRMRFVPLPPLTWTEALTLFPPEVDFEEAARIYVASDGNPRFLTELMELRGDQPFGRRIPVPQTMRAAMAVEARSLSDGARSALERLTVAPEPLQRSLVDAFGATSHLDELERSGWLRFDGRGWVFADRLARALLFEQLPPGHRSRLVDTVHGFLSETPDASAEARRTPPSCTPDADRTSRSTSRPVAVGNDLWLDDPIEASPETAWNDGTVHLVRLDRTLPPSTVTFHIPRGPVLVRLSGQAFVQRPSHDLTSRSPVPFASVTLGGRRERSFWLDDACEPSAALHAGVTLPCRLGFDHWILCDEAVTLSIVGANAVSVAEIEVQAYRPAPDPTPNDTVVEAFVFQDESSLVVAAREALA